MFMRRAKAYSSSCWQIALVCLQPFRRNSTLEVRGAAENCKKKQCNGTLYFLSSGSFKFINIDTTKKLVTKDCCDGSMPMPICNRFHGRLANNGKITTFMKYLSLMFYAQVEGKRDLDRWNLRWMLKISYAACLGLSVVNSAKFALEMCLTARNRQNSIKLLFWRSRSCKVIEFGANREPVYNFLSTRV